jgi:hypothetical protein
MLTIRQDQIEAFRQYHLQKFEDQMVVHLQKFAPQHWNVIGESTGREVIRFGMERANKYGFTHRGPVRFYIEMMFMFGSYFDTDPQCPWAIEILNDPQNMDQMLRADRLYDAMTKYWAEVAGPNNQFTFAALRKLSQAQAEDYVTAGVSLEDCFIEGLKRIYSQKCAYLGERPLRVLLKKTFELADKHGFTSNEEMGLMTAFTFFLGHECTRDPLHGWIARRLDDKRFASPAERSAELRGKGMLYLKHTLQSSEEPA